MAEVDKYAPESVNRILVGNKSDLEDARQVSYDEGKVKSMFYKIGIGKPL